MVESILFRPELWIIQCYQHLQFFFAHGEPPAGFVVSFIVEVLSILLKLLLQPQAELQIG
jgi:hypothetical protein